MQVEQWKLRGGATRKLAIAMRAVSARSPAQSWNWPAIAMAVRVLTRQPSLVMPHVEVTDLRGIDFRRLRALGFEGVVLDKDNTITEP